MAAATENCLFCKIIQGDIGASYKESSYFTRQDGREFIL